MANVAYAVFGRLNAARDNAVLVPSHYGADYHGYDFLVGPGKALDPERYYIVVTEMFGNGFSSSPSNTPVLHARTRQRHDVGDTPGFGGDHERALHSISARVLYMPCATDLSFPLGDAEDERQFLNDVTFTPIPSPWGHSAGGGGNPADAAFINDRILAFLAR